MSNNPEGVKRKNIVNPFGVVKNLIFASPNCIRGYSCLIPSGFLDLWVRDIALNLRQFYTFHQARRKSDCVFVAITSFILGIKRMVSS